MHYKLISTEVIFRGRAFTTRLDQLQLPDDRIVRLDVVEHVPAVTLVPVDEHGQVWFVRQYRHPAGEELLELPAGTMETGETPEMCAMREIREEIGMAAGSLDKIGEFFLAPGYSTELMHAYLARDLHPDPLPGDQDEFLSIEKFPFDQVEVMLHAGEIRDAKTIAALCLARPFLK